MLTGKYEESELVEHAKRELTDDPDEWQYHDETVWGAKGGIWQNRRDPSAFSTDGGKTYYFTGSLEKVMIVAVRIDGVQDAD